MPTLPLFFQVRCLSISDDMFCFVNLVVTFKDKSVTLLLVALNCVCESRCFSNIFSQVVFLNINVVNEPSFCVRGSILQGNRLD